MLSIALEVILQLRLLLSGDVELNPGPDTARLKERPTLRKLQCFQFTNANGKQKKITIIEATASRWRELGTALKLESYQLDNIERDNPRVKDRCRVVLETWLNDSDDPLTWHTLLLAMRDAGSTSVAQQVWAVLTDGEALPMLQVASRKWTSTLLIFPSFILVIAILGAFTLSSYNSKISDDSSPSITPLSDSLMQYQKYLNDVYSGHEYPLYSKPVISANIPEKPINLVLVRKEKHENDTSFIRHQELLSNGSVNEIQKQKPSVKTDEIGALNDGKMAHFVLIEGGPGMGKSTLCWQLCRLWREGKLQWDLMVIVELRHVSTRTANSLYDLFQYYPDDKIRQAIAQDIQRREGEGLLLFLDGYDELSNEQQNELSVIQQILTNKLLRKATVVVTSRPYAIASLPSQFKQALHQHIQIVGFNVIDIQTYITLACKDNHQLLENLRSYVNSHPFVLSVMYNPLHCSIVTELYIQYWQNGHGFAPQTLTELYNGFLLNMLRRHLPNLDIYELSDLPKHVYTNLMQLAELAASGVEKRQYIFSNITHDSLGLMVSVRKLYDIRANQLKLHTFLHLTLQEYLAALYWSIYRDKQPTKFLDLEIRRCLSLNLPNSELHRPFCSFFVGLTKIIEIDNKKAQTIDNFYIPQMCELLFEAQSSNLFFANTSITLPGGENYLGYSMDDLIESPLASFTSAYCLTKNSDNSTTFNFRIKKRKHLQWLADGMHIAIGETHWNEERGPTVRLHLTHNVNDILEVFPRYYPFTKSITVLSLSGDLNDKGVLIMKNLSYYCPRLTSLLITRNSSKSSITEMFHLPPAVDLLKATVYLPFDYKLLNNLQNYQALSKLSIHPERGCMCDVAGVCDSLQQVLPKLQEDLPDVSLFTLNINVPDQCVLELALLLKKSVVVLTTKVNKYYYNRLKNLYFYEKMDLSLATAIVQVYSTHTIKLIRVLISGSIDCDAAMLLVKNMSTKYAIAKRIVLHLNKKCKKKLTDIMYPFDRVKLIYL